MWGWGDFAVGLWNLVPCCFCSDPLAPSVLAAVDQRRSEAHTALCMPKASAKQRVLGTSPWHSACCLTCCSFLWTVHIVMCCCVAWPAAYRSQPTHHIMCCGAWPAARTSPLTRHIMRCCVAWLAAHSSPPTHHIVCCCVAWPAAHSSPPTHHIMYCCVACSPPLPNAPSGPWPLEVRDRMRQEGRARDLSRGPPGARSERDERCTRLLLECQGPVPPLVAVEGAERERPPGRGADGLGVSSEVGGVRCVPP